MRFSELWKKRDLEVLIISVILFHFGNGAMLPLAGQVIAKTHPGMDVISLSACIIAAQLVMVVVAATVGHAMHKGVGWKTIFLVALAVLPIRGVLSSMTDSPYAVVVIQLLKGVAAGIFGVVGVVIASDLMRGTGRFNLARGLTALAVCVGAALSNITDGYVVEKFGFTAGFLTLAAISSLALIFLWYSCQKRDGLKRQRRGSLARRCPRTTPHEPACRDNVGSEDRDCRSMLLCGQRAETIR